MFWSPIKQHPVVVFLAIWAITSYHKRKFSYNSHQLQQAVEDAEEEEEDISLAPRSNKTLQIYTKAKRTA